MLISDPLLTEFDEEMNKTRVTLERVPTDNPEFVPHPKSMPLGRLAPHVAQLPSFGLTVLTTPELDFSKGSFKPATMESAAQLVSLFDEGTVQARDALAGLRDEAWQEPWRLILHGKDIFAGSRFLAYRRMFLNHLVHHRAQLGIYLRLNGLPVPSIYGPSADETLGF